MVYGGGQMYGIGMKYFLGVFNGIQDSVDSLQSGSGMQPLVDIFNGARFRDVDTDTGKDFVGRFTLNPFPSRDFDANFSYSFTSGRTAEGTDKFRVSDESLSTIVRFVPGTFYDGYRRRHSFDFEILWQNLALGGEEVIQNAYYSNSAIDARLGSMKASAIWAAWIITGEKKSRDTVLAPSRKIGAFELVARFSTFEADSALVELGMPGIFTRNARQYAFGLNWYQTSHTRFLLDFLHASYRDEIFLEPNRSTNANSVIMAGFEVRF